MDPFCPFCLWLHFELPCTSVESYAGLYVKTIISLFRNIRRAHVPRTRYRYQVFIASSSSQQVLVPRSCCCMKRVTPLESTHGHHLASRAASARAARGRVYWTTRYCIIVLHRNPSRYQVITSDLNLCLQPIALIILKLGMIKVAVSNWSSKKSVMKLLRFESHKISCFFAFCEKGPFSKLKKSCIANGLAKHF